MRNKKFSAFILALLLIGVFSPAALAGGENQTATALKDTAAYVYQATPAPQVGSIGGEWAVLGLARSGYAVPASYYETYYAAVEKQVQDCQGVLDKRKYTEYSRVILALTAIGKDPTKVAGYDLTMALGDYEKTIWQGINGPIWALIALDSGNYDIPINEAAKTQASRAMYVERIVSQQLTDGGFSLTGEGAADPDITGMALQALAKYKNTGEVQAAIDKGVSCLSAIQKPSGGYASWGTENAESSAQVMVALAALGIDLQDSRFTQGEGESAKTPLDGLLGFYVEGGGFKHLSTGEAAGMASEQSLCALVAYSRWQAGKTNLYDMSDLKSDVEVKSADTSVASVQVNDKSTVADGDAHFVVTLPNNAQLPKAEDIKIMPTCQAAQVSQLQTVDDGANWSFIVQAEDGSTKAYTIAVKMISIEIISGKSSTVLGADILQNSGLSEGEQQKIAQAVQRTLDSTVIVPTVDIGRLPDIKPETKKVVFSLQINVMGMIMAKDGKIAELTMNIMPQYAVDGGAKALLPNTAINRMTITMNIPSGMNIDANTRIKHIGSDGRVDYLIPKINGSIFSFTVTKFSTFSIIADSSIAQVTYHLQGGDASGIKDGKTVVYYAQDDGMRLPIPTCEKYKFVGWYDKDSTKGQEYLKISAGLPKHLYAVWETKTTLKVSFRLIGDWPHDNGVRGHDHYITWIKTDTYPLEAGATVGDLFKMVCDQKGLDYQGFSSNYISSIQAPTEFGGYWLSEFDSGPNSGWMYTINGDHPNRGLTAWTLQDGDEVIWHYVDDYKEEAYFLGNPTKYPNRWLEAEDITPSQYLSKYGAPILSVGMGGTVSPTGDLSPYIGKNVTFTITPNAGYQVKNVVVDGKSMGVIGSYGYKNLQFTSRINVTFEPVKATIRFADMPIDHWAYSYVAYLTDKGVISGMTEELFGSNHKVKRGDFITMLARMSGDILPAYTGKFTDVSSGVYYASAVAWAVNSGVASGMSSTLFAPDKLIIRQDMAMMLSRYAAYKGINLPNNYAQVSFGDQDKISVYALDAVLKMQRSGILNGYENGNFLPLGDATRAEAAKMMTMLDQLK